MGTTISQVSFAGGEISPTLGGRTDLAKYRTSLRRMRNFFASRQGAAVSRPGTRLIGEVKNSALGKARLVPFVYSDNLAYVMEFGDQYIRIFSSDGNVVFDTDTAFITIPYRIAHLFQLKFAQVGAVLTITHRGYPPAELTYVSAGSWTYSVIDFSKISAASAGLDTATNATFVACSPLPPTAWNIGATYALNTIVTRFGTAWQAIQAPPVGTDVTNPLYWIPVGTWVGKTWQWATTVIWQDATGQLNESLPFGYAYYSTDNGTTLTALPVSVMVSQDSPVTLEFSQQSGWVGRPIIGYRHYRGQGGVYGYIGQSVGTFIGLHHLFTDQGSEPDYTIQPPAGFNPFIASSPSTIARTPGRFRKVATGNDYPAAVGFFEGSRVFAGTLARHDTVFKSTTGDFYNFDTANVPTESSPAQFALAAQRYEQIRSLAMLGPRIVALTQSSIWTIGGAGGGVLSDTSVDAKRHGDIGASWLDPLVIDASVLFARAKGTGVRSAAYDQRSETLVGADLSIYASHLFQGHQILDWCYAEDPWSVIWAVREDGVLLSATYVRDQEMVAWAWHDTAGGSDGAPAQFESICSIPNGTEDQVWVIVNRDINGTFKRYIEVFDSRINISIGTPSTRLIAPSLDCYKSVATTIGSSAVTGLSWLEGNEVYAFSAGSVTGPFTVTGGQIAMTPTTSAVAVGLAYQGELEQLNAALEGTEIKTREKQVKRASIEVDASRGIFAGPDFDNLTELKQRQVSDDFDSVALGSELYRMSILGSWDTRGRVCIRTSPGLPATIYGISRDLDFGDG